MEAFCYFNCSEPLTPLAAFKEANQTVVKRYVCLNIFRKNWKLL